MFTTDLIQTLALSPLGRTRSAVLTPLGTGGATLVGVRTSWVTPWVEVLAGIWPSEPEKLG